MGQIKYKTGDLVRVKDGGMLAVIDEIRGNRFDLLAGDGETLIKHKTQIALSSAQVLANLDNVDMIEDLFSAQLNGQIKDPGTMPGFDEMYDNGTNTDAVFQALQGLPRDSTRSTRSESFRTDP